MSKKFMDCQITVRSEKEKQEFLRACKHIHDFSIWFKKQGGAQNVYVMDEFGKQRKIDKKAAGVGLNDGEYPYINFLAGLHDSPDKKHKDKYIRIINHNSKKEG